MFFTPTTLLFISNSSLFCLVHYDIDRKEEETISSSYELISMKTSVKFALIILVYCLFPASLFAHDTWLVPKQFAVEKQSKVSLDMSSGMAFPAPLSAIKAKRIDKALYRLAGHQFELKNKTQTAKSLRFNAQPTESGIAAFWAELKPNTIDLSDEKVPKYLQEIGADKSILAEWTQKKAPKRWRETYTKHAKTFIKVGNNTATETTAWSEPVGLLLEIVPETDPTTLKVGDELSVRVLKQGQPMKNFPIGLVHESNHEGQIANTDEQGKAKFHLEKSGRYLLRGTELRKASQADIDWESSFTTLSLQVGTK